jgi:SEC-C motif-containing protein
METTQNLFRSFSEAEKLGLCPCGSEHSFAQCCGAVISGKKKAARAEDLMRARYTAFAQGNVDFIMDSHHSRTRHEIERADVESWSKSSKWLGLRVLETQKGEKSDDTGVVIFHARYESEGKEFDHFEYSQFEKENGEWKFLDAQALHPGPIRREGPKIGRNDPCPCGSGKKYKKCCADKNGG